MTWKGESRRHSLARKGIKTANGQCKMNFHYDQNSIFNEINSELNRLMGINFNDIKYNMKIKKINMTLEQYNECINKAHNEIYGSDHYFEYIPESKNIDHINKKVLSGNIFNTPYLFYHKLVEPIDQSLDPEDNFWINYAFIQEGFHRLYVSEQHGCKSVEVIVIYDKNINEIDKLMPTWLQELVE